MKNKVIPYLFACILSVVAAHAQDPDATKTYYIKKADTNILQTVKLDFAVPDIPAFKALGTDPSKLLRPSSPKELALMFSNVRSGGEFVVPQNLAVEITPGLLINPWYTLNQYQQKSGIRFLSKLGVSIGSDRDATTGVSSLAFGLRSVVFDKGDFRLDKIFLDTAIYRFQDNYTKAWSDNIDKVTNSYMQKHGLKTRVEYASVAQSVRDSVIEVARIATVSAIGFDLDDIVARSMREFKMKNWNAPRMDVAYSFLLQSPDSLLASVKLNKHLVWFAWAFRPGKTNRSSQFILGFNNTAYKANSEFYNEFTGNFRFYIGKNRLKGFFETQYQNMDHPLAGRTEILFSQVGVEVAVYKSIWIHFGTGVLNALDGSARSQLKSNLNLYFSFPENLKLF